MAHSLRVQYIIMVGKAQRQKHEGTGHVASLVRKQEEMAAGLHLFSFIYILQVLRLWSGVAHI